MRTFSDFIESVYQVTDIFSNKKQGKSQKIAPVYNGSSNMVKTMSNEELIKTIKLLKKDGIAYRYIAKKCNINESSFYDYMRRENFPYFAREVITKYVWEHFKEILENEL